MDGKKITFLTSGNSVDDDRRADPGRRRAWGRDYLNTLVRRDVADIAEVDGQQRRLQQTQPGGEYRLKIQDDHRSKHAKSNLRRTTSRGAAGAKDPQHDDLSRDA